VTGVSLRRRNPKPQPSLKEIRNRLGGPSLSDEELIQRVYADGDAVDALMSAGALKPKLVDKPLLQIIEELTRKKDCTHLCIRRNGL